MGEVYRHLRIIRYVVAVIRGLDRCLTVQLLQPQERLEISRAGPRNIGSGKKRRASYCSGHLKSRTIHGSDIRTRVKSPAKANGAATILKIRRYFHVFIVKDISKWRIARLLPTYAAACSPIPWNHP